MKLIITFFIIALVTSCSSTSVAGVDFHPSLKFEYLHNGVMVQAKGTAGGTFKVGDPLRIVVSNQGIWSRCHVGATNGDSYVTSSCKGSKRKFRVLDLGVIKNTTPEVIGVTMVKGGIRQFGFLYLDTGVQREELRLNYNCPLQSHSGRSYTCVRQHGYQFLLDIIVPEFTGSGKMQVISMKCNGGEDRKLYDVEAGQLVQVDIGSKLTEYCAYRFDIKTTATEVRKFSALLHINFFGDFLPED